MACWMLWGQSVGFPLDHQCYVCKRISDATDSVGIRQLAWISDVVPLHYGLFHHQSSWLILKEWPMIIRLEDWALQHCRLSSAGSSSTPLLHWIFLLVLLLLLCFAGLHYLPACVFSNSRAAGNARNCGWMAVHIKPFSLFLALGLVKVNEVSCFRCMPPHVRVVPLMEIAWQ